MSQKGFKYWWPRLLVAGFAVSLLLPAAGLISGMGHDQFVVYAARIVWVLGVPVVAGLVFFLIALSTRGKKDDPDA